MHAWSTFIFLIFTCQEPPLVTLRPIEGGEIVARVSYDGRDVILSTPMGLHRFPASDFRSIERPPLELPSGTSTPGECYGSALNSLNRGRLEECEKSIREAHRQDAAHQPSARIVAVLDRLNAPIDDPALAPLVRNLPKDRRIARGPHVLLMHQHSDEEAAERVALLETVISAYYIYFASIGLELPPPKERLASMWFAGKTDYLAFLKTEGATAFLTTRGFYQPTRKLVVAYDCRADPDRIKAREALVAATAEIGHFAQQVAKIPAGRRARIAVRGEVKSFDHASAKALEASLRRQVERREIVMELSRREMDWGVAAHETIHQLVAASRLCGSGPGFPNSLSEGLAMQFEGIEGGLWSGLGKPSGVRLRDYRKLASPPKIDPVIRDIGFGPGYKADDYARAWAVIYYLRVEKPKVFVALLDSLRSPAEPSTTPADRAGETLSGLLAADEAITLHRHIRSLPAKGEPPGG